MDASSAVNSAAIATAISSVVSGALVLLVRSRVDRANLSFKSTLDTKLELFRTELARDTAKLEETRKRVEARLQTRFSRLHDERATAMQEIYARLIDADERFERFFNSLGRLESDEGPALRYQAASAAAREFTEFYRPRRLLFSRSLAQRLDDLSRAFDGALNAFQRYLLVEKDEYAAFGAMYKDGLPDIPNYRDVIEDEFRTLYGTLDEVP